jgi:hypothetical protein
MQIEESLSFEDLNEFMEKIPVEDIKELKMVDYLGEQSDEYPVLYILIYYKEI